MLSYVEHPYVGHTYVGQTYVGVSYVEATYVAIVVHANNLRKAGLKPPNLPTMGDLWRNQDEKVGM